MSPRGDALHRGARTGPAAKARAARGRRQDGGRGARRAREAPAKKAVELDPLALAALVVVGRIQEATGQREEAVATYEDVNHRWAKTDDTQETDDLLLADARARLGIYRLSSEHEKNLDSVV